VFHLSDIAIFVFLGIGTLIFFVGLLKLTWNISKGGIDIMEFFGNVGRAGTRREQNMGDYKKEKNIKWNKDGSKEI
jgi:hypothetical protein